MRIAGPQRKTAIPWIRIILLGGVLVLFGLFFLRSVSLGGEDFYFCDMERTAGGGAYFKSQGKRFSNGVTRTDETAFQGRHAAKLGAEHVYGPGIEFDHVNGGDVFEASVWRNSTDGYGVLAFQGDWGFYTQATLPVQMTDEWELVKKRIVIPVGVHDRTLKIFPYLPNAQGVAYFDNLEIHRLRAPAADPVDDEAFVAPTLNIRVDEQSLRKLREKRLEAFSFGNLVTGKKDLVDAKLDTGGAEIPVRVRLKGDLLDHLQGRQWSFRIQTDDGYHWRNMSEFSVHNSLSRHHLDEWVFHQLLAREGLLTTRYDFLEVQLNGEALGIYAYEEHFTDELLLGNGRTPGLILRINEDGHWQYAPKQWRQQPPWYESAQYEPFDENDVLDDSERSAQFAAARDLLYGFLHRDLQPEDVFDTQKLATFLALVDLTNAYHAINYTNIRFYYDPHTNRLEPIGYDGYTDDGTKYYQVPLLTGSQINPRTPRDFTPTKGDAYLHYKLFNDMDFMRQYVQEVERVCRPSYREAFIEEVQPAVWVRADFIRKGYPEYDFQWTYYFRNGREIPEVLYPLPEISVKAYRSENGLTIENYHQLPLEVVALGDGTPQRYLPTPRLLEAFNRLVPVRRYELPIPGNFDAVFVRTFGTDTLVGFPIFDWQAPQERTVLPTAAPEDLAAFPFLSVNPDSQVVVAPGRHVVNRNLVVPEGFTLRIWAGTELELRNGASVICRGPLYLEGSADQPVRITAPGGDGGGLQVGNGPTVIRHAAFVGLGQAGLSESAVALHDGEFILEHCLFRDSRAADALGVYNARYEIRNCRVEQAASDGLDINFSIGYISGLEVNACGKDGLELSGGTAEMYDITIRGARESGLRLQRRAQATAGTLRIRDSAQGINCTGEAGLKVTTLEMARLSRGILVFRQEQVYGGAQVEVDQWTAEDVVELQVVESGSRLRLGDRWMEEN